MSELFEDRAQLEQDYDVGHLGRFQRHAIGFNMMLDHPLGIGAIEFGRTFGEDEHDIWLKTLTTYGWLGFAAFLTLVIWTLDRRLPARLPQRPAAERHADRLHRLPRPHPDGDGDRHRPLAARLSCSSEFCGARSPRIAARRRRGLPPGSELETAKLATAA